MKTKRIDDPHLTRPVRLVLVNRQDFGERLTSIAKILSRDNLQFAFHTIENKDTIKIMPYVEGDRSDCQPEASSIA